MRLIDIPYLSPSAAAKLTQCQRQFWWHYVGKVREGSSEPLAMGGGFAHALEFNDLAAGIIEYGKRRAPVDPMFTDPDLHKLEGWVGEATIRAAFDGYNLRTRDDYLIEREVTYIIDMPGADRYLQVRIDGVGPHHGVEDKLRSGTAMRAEALENERTQGRQLTAEIYAMWRETGELKPVQLRCVKKCDPRKWKQLTDATSVFAVIDEHFASDSAYVTLEATRTLEQLHEFEAEFASLARQADELAASPAPAGVRNTNACHMYGRVCPALAHCQGTVAAASLLTPNQEG